MRAFRHYSRIGLVYSIHDSTEEVIQKMIEGIRRMISPNNKNNNSSQQQEPEIPINPAMKRHYELEIETLQDAPKDEDKLREELLKLEEEENEGQYPKCYQAFESISCRSVMRQISFL